MRLWPARRSASVRRARRLLLDAQRQRLQPLEQHPGVERAERRAGLAQESVQIVGDEFLVGEDDAAEAAALAVDVLGRRIDDDVGAELERLLEERRGEDVVDDQPRPGLWAISATAAMSITSSVGLVGLSRKNALVFGRTAFFHCLRSLPSTSVERDAVARQQVLDDVAAGAEQRLGRDDMVAGLEPGEEDGGDRGHAAGRRARGLGAFEQAHALLEHGDGRVGVARIDEARLLALEARLGLPRRCHRRSPGSGRSPRRSRRTASAACRHARAGSPAARSAVCSSPSSPSWSPSRTTKNPAAQVGPGCHHPLRPFSDLFNVAASRPAK